MKKNLALIFCLLLSLSSLYGQDSYLKLIDKAKFSKAEKKINKSLKKEPLNVVLHYAKSRLLIQRKYNGYNPPISYEYLSTTEQLYNKNSDEKELEKLNKIPLNSSIILYYLDTICLYALDDAIEINTVESYENYLSYFLRASSDYKKTAVKKRDIAAFQITTSKNTVESYKIFISKYPDAIQVKDAWEIIYNMVYDEALKTHTIKAYENFIANYPGAKQVINANEKIHELAFEFAKSENSSNSYKEFIIKYPKSKQFKIAKDLFYKRQFEDNISFGVWESYRDFYENFEGPYKNVSRDSLIKIAISQNNTKALLYCITNELGEKKDLILKYYNQVSSDGELSTLNLFKKKFSDYLYLIEDFDTDYESAQLAANIGLTTDVFFTSVNTEMQKRLKREGAKTGAITISLMWDNYNDIDLHCLDPNGEEIFYGHKNSRSGGELDVDMNAGEPYSNEPVENIYWENSKAKKGRYIVYINHYSNHGCYECDPTNYTVVIKQNNIVKEFKGKIVFGDPKKLIYSFDFSNKNYGEIDLSAENKTKIDQYIKKAPNKELAFVAIQKLIAKDVAAKKWFQALSIIESYESLFTENKKFIDLKGIIKENSDYSIKIDPLMSINSDLGEEYSPVISGDSKSLFFCGYNRSDNYGGEDVYISKRENSGWNSPSLVQSLSNETANDALMAVSTDGSKSILFHNGKLAYSEKTMVGWSPLSYFPDQINNCSWNGDAMISSDGNALIFSSVREQDGFSIDFSHNEFYHSTQAYFSDIYVSLKQQDGWSNPINLGSSINTNFIERSPFFHPDMKTLYFSSDGHGGLGKLDVYKSTRLSDSCWNCWSEPINMGKEINTVSDDWGYRISTDGTTAYFSKKRDKSDDLFKLTLPPHLRPDIVAKIEGTLKNSMNEPISTIIRWEDLENNKVIGTARTDPKDGTYFIVLPMGKNYGYFIEDSTYFPLSQNLDLRNITIATDLKKDIKVITLDEMIKNGVSVSMNNLFFEFGKYELLSAFNFKG